MKKICTFAILVMVLLVTSISSYAALLGWDLVDDGKHLDWDSNTKYLSSVQSGVDLWEGHRSGVIRPDSIFVIQGVFISDYYEVSSTMGYTSSNGTIKFNDYNFANMTSSQRIKTATHELGHALGLDHTYGTNDIMRQGKLSITSLSSTDKASYDEAYNNY